MSEIKFTGIIPARYASSRFPGKPLALIHGKSMIERVYMQAVKALKEVWVATDDDRIIQAVNAFGGKAVLTSSSHRSGTDRCAEAVRKIMTDLPPDECVIINIQGDEPFIRPSQIEMLKECFTDPAVEIATLVRKARSDEDLNNINQPKVVLTRTMNALYFSRSVIPYSREGDIGSWASLHEYYKHLGIYGYKAKTLLSITQLKQSSLELAESLEQLRWLENGIQIRCAITLWESIGIDTPDDLRRAEEYLHSNNSFI